MPAVAPRDLDDQAPLEQPIEEEFRAGTMTLSWDPSLSRVVIEVFPISDEVVAGPEAERGGVRGARARGGAAGADHPGAARAFALRAGRVVEAGRPSCPFCGGPIDPAGHLCVRANGYRRREA